MMVKLLLMIPTLKLVSRNLCLCCFVCISLCTNTYIVNNINVVFLIDMSSIENVIGTNGTWDNIGLLAGVQSSLVGYAAELTNKYPGVKIAGIDSSPELNELLADENEGSILWGTDQQPFLQGYYPVQLLANKLRIGQNLQDFNLETGPTFVTEAPDTALLVCASNPFVSCDDTDMSEVKDTSDSASASGGTNMMLHGGMLCILFASYIFG